MVEPAKSVQLTASMRSMRASMRAICGEQYPARVAPWRDAIARVIDAQHVGPLQAAIQLVNSAHGNSLAAVAAMAAYVELMEPSILSQTMKSSQPLVATCICCRCTSDRGLCEQSADSYGLAVDAARGLA